MCGKSTRYHLVIGGMGKPRLEQDKISMCDVHFTLYLDVQ